MNVEPYRTGRHISKSNLQTQIWSLGLFKELECTPPTKFTGKNQDIFKGTASEFYSDVYGVRLDHPDLPMIRTKSGRNPDPLPMEFCTISDKTEAVECSLETAKREYAAFLRCV